jgi:hypothetical protein
MRLMSLFDRFDQLQSLSQWEIRLLLQASLLLHVTALGLRIFSYRRWQEMFVSNSPGANARDSARQLDRAQRTAALVRRAARYTLLPARCLEQSLVLARLLRQQRIPSKLCFGVRKEASQLHAHAWVECDGVPLAEPTNVSATFHALNPTHITPAADFAP